MKWARSSSSCSVVRRGRSRSSDATSSCTRSRRASTTASPTGWRRPVSSPKRWANARRRSAALALHTDSLLSVASDDAPDSWECAAFNEVFLQRYDDARLHLEHYVALAEPNEIPLNLGFLHLRHSERSSGERILEEGEARARAAVAGSPRSWEPHFELAEIAAMRGEVEGSVEHLAAAVEFGLGREWWVFHLFSREALPDPVFEPLYGHPRFERLRDRVLSDRAAMGRRIYGEGRSEGME